MVGGNDLLARGLADVLVVSGAHTGAAPETKGATITVGKPGAGGGGDGATGAGKEGATAKAQAF
mgnify:CR=1 FL=1